ncbi:MAG: helix-turn-helix domain-containing protein, partial [Pseudomonadota bacterium]
NRDLEVEIATGRFREDLFFRLNVLPLHVPPLRARKNDIPDFVNHFIEKSMLKNKTSLKTLSTDALEKLLSYDWPGNIRELESILNRALILSEGEMLTPHDFSFASKAESHVLESPASEKIAALREDGSLKTLEEIEHAFFEFALARCQHNVTRTAREIGVAKSTLYRKINMRVN